MGLIAIFGTVAGILGTLIGAILGLFFGEKERSYRYLMCFAGGMLLALAAFELIPTGYEQSVEALGAIGILFTVGLFLVGFLGITALGALMDRRLGGHNHAHGDHCTHRTEGMKAGILMAVGLMLHNLPEGFALGAAGSVSWKQGLIMALLIAIHNLPCGIAVTVPLIKAGMKKVYAVSLAAASGIPMIVGAILGYLLGNVNVLGSSAVITVAAGILLQLIFQDMLREGYEEKGKFSSVILILSFIFGFLILKL